MEEKDLRLEEKQQAESGVESTEGRPLFVPRVDIYEDKDALTLLMDMPGVDKGGVSIQLENNQLMVYGKVNLDEAPGERMYSEYRLGDYTRTFALSGEIDQAKIEAGMKHGVLRLHLPKAEALKPRKIDVKVA